jgi:putative ABC transport system ATP-binding protein
MDDTIVKAEGLTKIFRLPAEEVVAVDRVDLEIKKGDFVSLMGPSGSGKTTLLDLLGCLDSISGGNLTVFGKDVSSITEDRLVSIRRGRIGFVFQEFLLLPELTAVENVEIPMTFARMPVDRPRALNLLDKVGLAHRANHLPRELSGGERQRVAIARSLAVTPRLLLADEPTGNLDTKNSREIFSVFERLNSEDGLTIVVATHDDELGSRAGRVVRLVDGKIVS